MASPFLPEVDSAYFVWATGIEDTFVPQTRGAFRSLDEYELMGHYEHWREDLALVRDLGVGAVRWGVPWYRVEPRRGEFDWSWLDQVLPYIVQDVNVNPIIDLIHYGCPLWLARGFADPSYSDAVAAFAGAFAERYRSLVSWYTPLNEPLITALMCGRLGVWPPYLRGSPGYAKVLLQVIRGMQKTVAAIKSVERNAVIVLVEATGPTVTGMPQLRSAARESQLHTFLPVDLFMGRVTDDHPLFPWLLNQRTSLSDLEAIAAHKADFDILGLNFYPQWGTKELYVSKQGLLRARTSHHEGSNFVDLLRQYHDRYRCVLMITETSAHGSHEERSAWLCSSLATIKEARRNGIPIVGYTWFPLFTMIDWKYRTGRGPMSDFLLELGMFRWQGRGKGPRWQPTPLVPEFQRYATDTTASVGRVHAAVAVSGG
jgi:beta-glucosidase